MTGRFVVNAQGQRGILFVVSPESLQKLLEGQQILELGCPKAAHGVSFVAITCHDGDLEEEANRLAPQDVDHEPEGVLQ